MRAVGITGDRLIIGLFVAQRICSRVSDFLFSRLDAITLGTK